MASPSARLWPPGGLLSGITPSDASSGWCVPVSALLATYIEPDIQCCIRPRPRPGPNAWILSSEETSPFPCLQNLAIAAIMLPEGIRSPDVSKLELTVLIGLQLALGVCLPLLVAPSLAPIPPSSAPVNGSAEKQWTSRFKRARRTYCTVKIAGLDVDDFQPKDILHTTTQLRKIPECDAALVRVFEGQSVGWRVCRVGAASLPRSSTNPGAS